MPYKDKAARYAAWKNWAIRNADKVKARNRKNAKNYWTNHERPKRPFDRSENRRRIKELRILGIHFLIVGEVKTGFRVVPKLLQSANGCVDCGITKRLMLLDSVTVKTPRFVLRFPFTPLAEKYLERAEPSVIALCANHCEHLRFDDIGIAKKLAYDFKLQCDCYLTNKRTQRLEFESFQMDIAFCRECWSRHAADNFNFNYCPPCMCKLLDSKRDFARLSLHSQWSGEGFCKYCSGFIEEIHSRIRDREFDKWAKIQREVKAFKFAQEANKKYAFVLEKDWSLEAEFEKFEQGQREGLQV